MSAQNDQDPFSDDDALDLSVSPRVSPIAYTSGDSPEARQEVQALASYPTAKAVVDSAVVEKDGDNKVARHWSSGETIAAFLAFEVARRQKSTSTKTYRVDFAASCFPKFAKQLKTEGKFDDNIDIVKSRDVRFKYVKTG